MCVHQGRPRAHDGSPPPASLHPSPQQLYQQIHPAIASSRHAVRRWYYSCYIPLMLILTLPFSSSVINSSVAIEGPDEGLRQSRPGTHATTTTNRRNGLE
eukprot:UN23765